MSGLRIVNRLKTSTIKVNWKIIITEEKTSMTINMYSIDNNWPKKHSMKTGEEKKLATKVRKTMKEITLTKTWHTAPNLTIEI